MILPINEFTIDILPDFTSVISQEEVKLEIYHSHYDELKELLKQGISISVYPHPCYQGEFTYETYNRLPALHMVIIRIQCSFLLLPLISKVLISTRSVGNCHCQELGSLSLVI